MVDGRGVASAFTAETFAHFWVGVLGPPVEVLCDQGSEFQGRIASLCEVVGTSPTTLPQSAKWRNGLAERHGATAELMIMKVVFVAKNRLGCHDGIAPVQELLGIDPFTSYSGLVPASDLRIEYVANDEISRKAHLAGKEQIRCACHVAFHWLDSCEKLRVGFF